MGGGGRPHVVANRGGGEGGHDHLLAVHEGLHVEVARLLRVARREELDEDALRRQGERGRGHATVRSRHTT